MDPGRYGLQQGWDNNSALEGYGAAHEPNFRVDGSFDERSFLDERNSRDNIYSRNAFQRERYPPQPVGLWPQSRRRNYEEDYSLDRESSRHEKSYNRSYHEMDTFRGHDIDSFQEFNSFPDGYRNVENYRDHGFDRPPRFGGRDRDDYDDYDNRSRSSHRSREDSREREYDFGRNSYDSDYDIGSRKDGSWRRHEYRDRDGEKRCLSRERELSPHRRHELSGSRSLSRSRSRGHDDRPRSRSPRGRSHGRSHREDSYDDGRYDRIEKRRDRKERHSEEQYGVAPSATIVVKGLSQKTTEEDLYQILTEWGPLRHVRVIKERNSGVSRGFAFIDFPSVGAARAMMDKIGDDGLVVDGRKLFFEYSSKPTGCSGGKFGHESAMRTGNSNQRNSIPCDWVCTICGCVNFARRISCFQCNEPRTEDAPLADMNSSNQISSGKKGSGTGPTHVLVVRGLDECADEEMLRYEFSKQAPIKDLRLVRDKFTHVSRGFAFVHFHSVEDASKALEATNGTTLEKNGLILRVAYAKSIFGPGSGMSASSQSSSLAAAAIEAAAFSQQYDAVGWAPKEYNADDKQSAGGQERGDRDTVKKDGLSLQSGFVWDEASGYYYDAASGFYYDGNTGLYYDGNSGIWYSYDHQTQQYIPCTNENGNSTSGKESEPSKPVDGSMNRKVVISAPAATISSVEKPASLPDAVQAAATAAIAAERKGKEKSKEMKLISKSTIVANKKKLTNAKWQQWSRDNQQSASADDRAGLAGQTTQTKFKSDSAAAKEDNMLTSGAATPTAISKAVVSDSPVKPKPVSNSSGGTLMGVVRNTGRGFHSGFSVGIPTSSTATTSGIGSSSSSNSDTTTALTPFRTDASALGSYTPPVAAGSGKRRFSEMPLPSATQKEPPQTTYRDRAAERRSLYGSSSSTGDDLPDAGFGDSNRESALKKGSADSMPFPPGVGGRGLTADSVQSYEVITADKAIDENNVGNRMLRSMGWQEGLGLGKDGSGMIEPVQAQAMDSRAGLGSQQKKVDPTLEVQAGDSYKTLIHKKALARFREMS